MNAIIATEKFAEELLVCVAGKGIDVLMATEKFAEESLI